MAAVKNFLRRERIAPFAIVRETLASKSRGIEALLVRAHTAHHPFATRSALRAVVSFAVIRLAFAGFTLGASALHAGYTKSGADDATHVGAPPAACAGVTSMCVRARLPRFSRTPCPRPCRTFVGRPMLPLPAAASQRERPSAPNKEEEGGRRRLQTLCHSQSSAHRALAARPCWMCRISGPNQNLQKRRGCA